MAFQIKRKSPTGTDTVTKDKYEDAIHVARDLIAERVTRAHTSVTNLKTGETMNEAQIEEAVLSMGPQKQRMKAA